MKVVLLEDDVKLGNNGDVVNVKRGYGNNFLIPNKKALLASKSNVSMVSNVLKLQNKKIEKARAEQMKIADSLKDIDLSFKVKASLTGHIFGTITNEMVVEKIKELKNIEVSKKKLAISSHIKTAGVYSVKIKLFSGVDVSLPITVTVEVDEKKADIKRKSKKKRFHQMGREAIREMEEHEARYNAEANNDVEEEVEDIETTEDVVSADATLEESISEKVEVEAAEATGEVTAS